MRPGPAALLVSVLICLLPSAASAAGRWVTPETVSATGTGSASYFEGRTIGSDAAGGLDVAWQQSEAGGLTRFYTAHRAPRAGWTVQQLEPGAVGDAALAETPGGTAILAYALTGDSISVRWRPAGGSWSSVAALTGGTQIGSPRVGIADDGTATVVWRSSYNGDIYAVRGTVTGGFGTPELVATDSWLPDVAVSPAGESIVSLRSGWYDVAVAERGPSAVGFGTPVVVGTARSQQPGGSACVYRNVGAPAVTVSPSGRAVVAWSDTCADYVRDIDAAVRSGGVWGAATTVGDLATSSRNRVRVASDDAGDVVVGFELGAALRVAELPAASTSWAAERLVFDASGASVDGVPSLDMGPGGQAVFTDGIAAGGSNSRVAIAYRSAAGGWTTRDETSRSCYLAPRAPQAAVDPAGDGVVAFGCYLNPAGGPASFTEHATAYAAPPAISAVTVPATGETGQSLAMAATSSGPGAWGDAAAASLAWDFGDGSPGAAGASVTHAYATTGARTVTVTADDGGGSTAAVTRTVTVSRAANRAPIAAFAVTPAGRALTGDTLTLDPSASRDPDPDGSLVRYEWDLDGDGAYEQTEATGVAVTHTFTTAGAHHIGLRVTDDRAAEGNGTATATGCVEVLSPAGAGPGDGVTPGCDGTVTGGGAAAGTATTPAPAAGGATTAPAPAGAAPTPGCGHLVEIGPLQAFAVDCWEREGLTWKTTGRVRLNGIDLLPAEGAGNVVVDPLNLKVSTVGVYNVSLSIPRLPPVTIYSGVITWSFGLGRPSWLPLLPFEIDAQKQAQKDAKDSVKVSGRAAAAPAAPQVPGFTGCPDPNADPKAPKPAAPPADPKATGIATQVNCFVPPKIEIPGLVKLPTIAIPVGATADLVGMKLKGHAGLQLVSGGAELSLSASVPKEWLFGIVGDTAGQAVVRATMADGVRLDSLGVDVGETDLLGVKLKDVHVGYDGARDRWEGALHAELPLPAKPLFGGQMAFERKRLVALGIHTDGLNKPLFAGMFLQRIDVDVDTAGEPKLHGGVGVTAGPIVLGKAAARSTASSTCSCATRSSWR